MESLLVGRWCWFGVIPYSHSKSYVCREKSERKGTIEKELNNWFGWVVWEILEK